MSVSVYNHRQRYNLSLSEQQVNALIGTVHKAQVDMIHGQTDNSLTYGILCLAKHVLAGAARTRSGGAFDVTIDEYHRIALVGMLEERVPHGPAAAGRNQTDVEELMWVREALQELPSAEAEMPGCIHGLCL